MVLLVVWMCGRASCTWQQSESRTLPLCASEATSRNMHTNPRSWRTSVFLWNVSAPGGVLQARAAAAGRGPRLTRRSRRLQMADQPLRTTPPEKRRCQIYFAYNLLESDSKNRTHSSAFTCTTKRTSRACIIWEISLFWWHYTDNISAFSAIIIP